ncbi:MAG: type II toxin-antitoxin system VapC family toxin [Promethearchaeia archaeon]
MILVDSNIWAYYFDASLPEHNKVIKPLEAALEKNQVAINAIIVVETLHYLVKRLGSLEGKRKGRVFLGYGMPLYEIDEEIVTLTLMKLSEFTHLGIGGRDATILATMSVEGIHNLMTHDQAFKRIPEIDVIDPI